mgnify:CR=1 FL=1
MGKTVDGGSRAVLLAKRWQEAKDAESAWAAERIRVEEELIATTNFKKPEGSSTLTLGGEAGKAQVTFTQPIARSVSASYGSPEFRSVASRLVKALSAARVAALFPIKLGLSKAELDALEQANRDLFLIASVLIEERPGPVGVNVASLILADTDGA